MEDADRGAGADAQPPQVPQVPGTGAGLSRGFWGPEEKMEVQEEEEKEGEEEKGEVIVGEG